MYTRKVINTVINALDAVRSFYTSTLRINMTIQNVKASPGDHGKCRKENSVYQKVTLVARNSISNVYRTKRGGALEITN
jgi:hypothetical protein